MAEDRVGPERIKTSYAWRTIIDKGSIIIGGFIAEPVLAGVALTVGVFLQHSGGTGAQGAVADNLHPREDPRMRIEHFQIVTPDDIDRALELGVLPAMQFTHATSDWLMAEDRVGPMRV